MRTNPLNPVYKACNTGDMQEKLENPLPFPRIIDIELTNQCNFRCKMCPTGTGASMRPRGFMPSSLFNKILQESARHTPVIRFVRWGEPFLHVYCTKFIELVKTSGMLCHINTNGSFMDYDCMRAIIRTKLDSIKFSLQGLDCIEYAKFRGVDKFVPLLESVKQLKQMRGNKPTPFIQIGTTTLSATTEDIKEFKQTYKDYADNIVVGVTRDLVNGPLSQCHGNCPEVFDKLSIDWDGHVTACCGDWNRVMVLGDLYHNTLENIWNGKTLSDYRKMLAAGRHGELELCRRCQL